MNKPYSLLTTFVFLFLLMGCSKEEPKENELSLFITGQIDLAPELKKYTNRSDTIFLMAKPAMGGPPIAVEKFRGNKYPIQFTLSENNIMMPDQFRPVPLSLTVRVDKDGNPMSKNPGDLTGTYPKNPVSLHARNIDITVDKKIR